MNYGDPPISIKSIECPHWDEFMHYLYLPIAGPDLVTKHPLGPVIPERLRPISHLIASACMDHALTVGIQESLTHYVYVTARRGYATPENPINRPGWHCDGFGTDDINYVWCNRWPTLWFDGSECDLEISPNHTTSMEQFTDLANRFSGLVKPVEVNTLYRFSPYVIHAAPDAVASHLASQKPPEGMRSFVKVSFSKHRYNLKGNSHNHLFDYNWRMYDRSEIRNDPAEGLGDFHEENNDG